MASITNLTLSIVKDVANADITVKYDINWSDFDKLTGLQYMESWKLIGDDTGQDGDDGVAGDDPISLGLMPVFFLSANGQDVTERTLTKTLAFNKLNEDTFSGSDGDDEIRAVVTLTPSLPATVSRESGVFVVNA